MKTGVINWPGGHRARILGCGILLDSGDSEINNTQLLPF